MHIYRHSTLRYMPLLYGLWALSIPSFGVEQSMILLNRWARHALNKTWQQHKRKFHLTGPAQINEYKSHIIKNINTVKGSSHACVALEQQSPDLQTFSSKISMRTAYIPLGRAITRGRILRMDIIKTWYTGDQIAQETAQLPGSAITQVFVQLNPEATTVFETAAERKLLHQQRKRTTGACGWRMNYSRLAHSPEQRPLIDRGVVLYSVS